MGDNIVTGLNPLADHWDGTAWTQVFVPDGTPGTNVLYAVKAIAPDDTWAVGYQDAGFADFQPLIEHWDGTAWAVVPAPVLAGSNNFLHAIDASSSTDVWAVGSYRPDSEDIPLLLHWDGVTWTQYDGPVGSMDSNLLNGVSVISPTEAWAVGYFLQSTGITQQPYVLYWNGATWSLQSAQIPGGANASFFGADAAAPRDVWAVGASTGPRNGLLTEHSAGAC